jgi:major membrane immunogen (membrane-anchored lipoprotein)
MRCKTLCTLLLGIVTLTGCSQQNEPFIIDGEYQGYVAKITTKDRQNGRMIYLKDGINFVRAQDYNQDGRFDQIILDAPIGHPFEQYATIPQMEKAYQTILENALN